MLDSVTMGEDRIKELEGFMTEVKMLYIWGTPRVREEIMEKWRKDLRENGTFRKEKKEEEVVNGEKKEE